MQRLGIGVREYSVLNIHKIGIEAPVRHVFEELLNWDGNSISWPNHIATVQRIDGSLEHIKILLCGGEKISLDLKDKSFRLSPFPLFNLDALCFQRIPNSIDMDNARFLLYKCSGGYPIGIFSVYVRSSISEQKERAQTQFFMVVGFNFYGKATRTNLHIINRIWESIHNRVSANVMNRFKQFCEWRFERMVEGRDV